MTQKKFTSYRSVRIKNAPVSGVRMKDETFAWWHPGYRWFCVRMWFMERPEKIAWWVAWHLPRRVALLAFVRVYGFSGDGPGADYDCVYKAWTK